MIIYNCILFIYKLLIIGFAPFNKKARLWLKGQSHSSIKQLKKPIAEDIIVWFHASSLGEFEQGRPLIEKMKEETPNVKILLTFFSPSGYEIRKNYPKADYIAYLPLDSANNASYLIEVFHPVAAIFIKYEFWYHYIKTLHNHNIPVYLVSAIFRPTQMFFSWYGGFYRNILRRFKHVFVQNQESYTLLQGINVNNVSVTGDTRFDRVSDIAAQAKSISIIDTFLSGQQLFIAGSTWPEDEDIICRFINEQAPAGWKYIIAPHEIASSRIQSLVTKIKKPVVLFSQASQINISDFDVLLIDNIGLLSSIYKYGQIAYIGGGFGKGIHNTLEAAVFGMPVLFGPNYQKFDEACALVNLKAALPIQNYIEFHKLVFQLQSNKNLLYDAGINAAEFVTKNKGATLKIFNVFNQNFLSKINP